MVDSEDGKKKWVGGENVSALAYDVPIPGFRTKNTISLRLWSTRVSAEDFNLEAFNSGDYGKADEAQANAERVSKPLSIFSSVLFGFLLFHLPTDYRIGRCRSVTCCILGMLLKKANCCG